MTKPNESELRVLHFFGNWKKQAFRQIQMSDLLLTKDTLSTNFEIKMQISMPKGMVTRDEQESLALSYRPSTNQKRHSKIHCFEKF